MNKKLIVHGLLLTILTIHIFSPIAGQQPATFTKTATKTYIVPIANYSDIWDKKLLFEPWQMVTSQELQTQRKFIIESTTLTSIKSTNDVARFLKENILEAGAIKRSIQHGNYWLVSLKLGPNDELIKLKGGGVLSKPAWAGVTAMSSNAIFAEVLKYYNNDPQQLLRNLVGRTYIIAIITKENGELSVINRTSSDQFISYNDIIGTEDDSIAVVKNSIQDADGSNIKIGTVLIIDNVSKNLNRVIFIQLIPPANTTLRPTMSHTIDPFFASDVNDLMKFDIDDDQQQNVRKYIKDLSQWSTQQQSYQAPTLAAEKKSQTYIFPIANRNDIKDPQPGDDWQMIVLKNQNGHIESIKGNEKFTDQEIRTFVDNTLIEGGKSGNISRYEYTMNDIDITLVAVQLKRDVNDKTIVLSASSTPNTRHAWNTIQTSDNDTAYANFILHAYQNNMNSLIQNLFGKTYTAPLSSQQGHPSTSTSSGLRGSTASVATALQQLTSAVSALSNAIH